MKPITLLCFGALAMFSNVANAAMCKDFDEDMNVIEYECGTSLQKALEQQKQKKIEKEDDIFAEFDKNTKTKKQELQKYIGGNLIYSASNKIKADNDSVKIGTGGGFNVSAGIKQGQLRGDIEFKYLSGMGRKETYYGMEYPPYYGPSLPYTDEYNLDISSMNLMLNGYFDFTTFGAVTPFVGFGFGMIHMSLDMKINHFSPYSNYTISESDSYSAYAYHVGGGLSFAFNKSIVLDLSYRYNGTGKLDDAKFFNSELLLGGRILF